MIIEITEEEREFLHRICTPAELFASMGIAHLTGNKDLEKIIVLKDKFYKREFSCPEKPYN